MPCIEEYNKVDLRTVSFEVLPQEVSIGGGGIGGDGGGVGGGGIGGDGGGVGVGGGGGGNDDCDHDDDGDHDDDDGDHDDDGDLVLPI